MKRPKRAIEYVSNRLFCVWVTAALILPASLFSKESKDNDFDAQKISLNSIISNQTYETETAIRYNDIVSSKILPQGGQSIAANFINFLFPVSGKEKRVVFMPFQYWGQKKPQYKSFKWQRFESQHFVFLTYDFEKDPELLKALVRIFEENHEHNSWLYGVDNRIKKKIPIILFRSRPDFEHTHALPNLVPESMGGWTEVQSWNRVIFGFDGDKAMFEHVSRHEANHIYHIAKGTRNIPIWFIEGSAEMNSIKWDASAEAVIRDAYFNNYMFHIKDLWQVRGTWIMYKEGNYITNYIVDNYGEEAIRNIFSSAKRTRFSKNLKKNLGINLKELDDKIFAKLNSDYGKLGDKKDDVEKAKELTKGKLLAARGDFFITGKYKNGKFQIFLNYIDPKWGHVSKKIISDQEIHNESLHLFKSMAGLGERKLAYVMDIGPQDAVRIVNYGYNSKKRSIYLDDAVEYKWPGITAIYDPVFIDKGRIAFVGLKDAYTNIYMFDPLDDTLKQVTTDNNYYRGLTYSKERNILVYSREGERINKPCRYNYDLWMYNLSVNEFKKLTDTEFNDLYPSISPDGSKIAFQGDKGDVYNVFLYDMGTGKVIKATDVKIAAYSPMWMDNSKLYFGSVNKFRPAVYKMKIPTVKIAFSRNLPAKNDKFYKLFHDELYLDEDLKKEALIEEVSFKSKFLIKGEKLYVVDNKMQFEVKNFVSYAKGFVVATVATKRLDWENSKEEVLFSYSNGILKKLTRNQQLDHELNTTVADIVKEFKKDKSIMGMWVSPLGETIFILVNHKLSFIKKKGAQTLFMINVKDAKISELPYKRGLSGIRDKIEKIYFLKNSKSLIAVARSDIRRRTYYQYYLFDAKENSFEKMFHSPSALDFSNDWQYFLRVKSQKFGKGKVTLFDAITGKTRTIFPNNGQYRVINAHFIENGNIFITLREKGKAGFRVLYMDTQGKIIFEKRMNISKGFKFALAQSSQDGTTVVFKINDERTRTGIQKLYFYKRGEDSLKEVTPNLSYFSDIKLAENVLIFKGKDIDGVENLYSYENRMPGRGYTIDSSDYSEETNSLVVGGGEDILKIDLKTGKVRKVIDKSFGFDVYKNYLVFSSYIDGYYNIFLYDLSKDKLKRLTKSWFNELSPRISAAGIAYTVDEETRFSLHVRGLKNEQIKRIHFDDLNVFNPFWKGEELYFNISEVKKKSLGQIVPIEKRGDIWSFEPLDLKLMMEKTRYGIRPQRFYGGIAFDGSNIVVLLSMTADNIFSDRGIFINAIYRTNFINTTVGYTNLAKGRTYTFYINQVDENKYGGLSFRKAFLLDKYQEFDFIAQLEYQDFIPDEFKGDKVEFPDETVKQYVLKSGVVYAADTSLWDMHGPMSGAKMMASTEMGVSLKTGKLSNIDVNLDFRYYNLLLRRVGLAHRLMLGTSQGNYPTIFFLGGNLSFRGVSFDGLEGNNYWVFTEDLRIPLFDIVGGKLPDPVDSALGPFFRYFDVRGGLYFDIGQVWFSKNDDLERLLYSFGFFINTPTIFGMILRFSKGLVGKKGFNFWFGANW